jgi:hypothetical protein
VSAEEPVHPLARYGLIRKPFECRVLDPELDADDIRRMSPVDGFEKLEAVRQWMGEITDRDGPCAIVIKGPDGTGRSSCANHLLRHYRELRDLEPHRFVRIELRLDGWRRRQCSELALLREMAGAIRRNLRRSPAKPADRIIAELNDIAMGRNGFAKDSLGALLDEAASEMDAEGAGFGVVIERVATIQQITAVHDVFTDTKAIVVLTVDDMSEIRRELKDYRSQVHGAVGFVDLDQIDVGAAGDLVKHLWDHASEVPGAVPPLGARDIRRVLDWKKVWRAGELVPLMRDLFDKRIGRLGMGPRWPHPDLLFTEDDRDWLEGRG